MSEFQLYVLNKDLPNVLAEMQSFGGVSFRNLNKQAHEEFKQVESNYDFQENRRLQEYIKKTIAAIEKHEKHTMTIKDRKKQSRHLLDKLSYEELMMKAQEIDIDELLSIYAEDYDSMDHTPSDFTEYKPWSHQKLDVDVLHEFVNTQPILRTFKSENRIALEEELASCNAIYYMIKEEEAESILIAIVSKSNCDDMEVFDEMFKMDKRSARSLELQDEVAYMQNAASSILKKRVSIEENYHSSFEIKEQLRIYYEYLRNIEVLEKSKENFIASDHFVVIGGYVEDEYANAFKEKMEEVSNQHCEIQTTAAKSDNPEVPVKLKNKGVFKTFEIITNMYSIPRYDEIDPTPYLSIFYAVFFGMMLADVGYGLVIGIGAFLLSKSNRVSPNMKPLLRFLSVLSIPTIIWGFVYGSFFSGAIPLHAYIDLNNDFYTVLLLSLVFGIVHLFFGLALKGYLHIRNGKPLYVIFDVVFWYMALVGAIILVSGMFTDIFNDYRHIAKIIMIIGMVGIVLTNGREAKSIPGKFASGLYSLYGISNYIGDIVSYSRLMALGLAGSSIAMAFNMIIELLSGFGIPGIIGGAIFFFIGHGFNMFISGLSAYVHSARLTYVEFFGKFYTGGGVPFQPFRASATYIQIL